ncbi:hypothetical protein [Longimicrobium terrae]|uniref:Outer membrane protein beta-barrel domain-containing protein n=1 Tax=Longimicrobium terrae TaxID=1639882 RepID=A0A841GZS0_9BACT|nr:hypothetical protein [Longimicrobium terrae]MBB4636700.1 hypothetical protein [Longimicrobium terrae]MBB6071301.1 hypothetical protein [Longimicrobium terrae]NNC29345.1 hypothetical protein [Longimicrobium terrae]
MRFGVLVLAGALALPAVAAAQQTVGLESQPHPDLVPPARFSLTPWVGYRVPTGFNDVAAVGTDAVTTYNVRTSRGGGVAVGLNGEARVFGPVNAVASIGYSPGDQDEVTFNDGEDGGYVLDGPDVTFLKAGIQYRLPDPIPDQRRYHPAAFVTVAPAVVWMSYPDIEGFGENVNFTSREFALNLGVDAVTMLNSHGVGLSFGVEDYITFVDRDRLRLRQSELASDITGDNTTFNVDYSTNNLLLLRAGVSWRF